MLLPVTKLERFADDCSQCGVGQKPIPNIFNKEVYFALNTRGGAFWERMHQKHGDKKDNQAAWSDVWSMKNKNATTDYNARFNLPSSRTKITKTLLTKITQQVERVASSKPKEEQQVTEKEFIDACVAGGLVQLSKEEFGTMFKSIDKDGSGHIDVSEWLAAVEQEEAPEEAPAAPE